MELRSWRVPVLACLLLVVLFAALAPGQAQGVVDDPGFVVTPLVSDLPGVADFTDARLVNPWGMTTGNDGLIWIANNGTGTAVAYNRNGKDKGHSFTVPPAPGTSGTGTPTGIVRLPDTKGFRISQGGRRAQARIIVATEDGTIAAWSSKVNEAAAITQVVQMYSATERAVFKGLATARGHDGQRLLFATDFRGGVIDVYDRNWNLVDSFTDPAVPPGFAPFGIHSIGNRLWVTFALQDATGEDDVPGPGNGFVDVFDVDGAVLVRFASGGPLNSPWGVTEAREAFTGLPDTVLIGNFGDGRINVYDIQTGDFIGQLAAEDGVTPLAIEGLWAIDFFPQVFGSNPQAVAQARRTLFFTAGINDEVNGLYGRVLPVP